MSWENLGGIDSPRLTFENLNVESKFQKMDELAKLMS